ncbi:MAG: 3-oxoacyl-[acyl-carrier protein] reductase [Halioglobus sp.]|jgi:3-oxoacyl-[acyl-carrier protein] reductase
MDLGLKNKIVFVSAASQGLGKAIAMAFQAEGASVAICARNAESLRQAQQEVQAVDGREVLAIVADVAVPSALENAVETVQSTWGAIDILVNNAGGPPAGGHDSISDQQWQDSFELTVQSAVRLTNLVLPGMKASGWGRIVNVSSASVKQPMANMLLSNSLRLAVLGWAKTLATELAPYGILVNTVCPGWTETNRVKDLLDAKAAAANTNTEQIKQSIANSIPVGRMGQPDEIANVVLFFASAGASFVTGTALAVDGGAAQVF